jgi:hypothetical protein
MADFWAALPQLWEAPESRGDARAGRTLARVREPPLGSVRTQRLRLPGC